MPTKAMPKKSVSGLSWYGQKVFVYEEGLEKLSKRLPVFDRQPFKVGKNENTYYDVIISNLPKKSRVVSVPVSIVSKKYQLLQHTDVFKLVIDTIAEMEIDCRGLRSKLEMTEYGERIRLILTFPSLYIDPGDKNNLELQLICFNSVDKSRAFEIYLGWYRLICSNGLLYGEGIDNYRRIHQWPLHPKEIAEHLQKQMFYIEKEKNFYEDLYYQQISDELFIKLVNGPLVKAWGAYNAARLYHICRTGHDGILDKSVGKVRKGMEPTEYPLVSSIQVPGSPKMARNKFDVLQALAWLAKERKTIQDQWERMTNIFDLIKKFPDNDYQQESLF